MQSFPQSTSDLTFPPKYATVPSVDPTQSQQLGVGALVLM